MKPSYHLNSHDEFIIQNYNHAKTFSNFFPGVAGLWGIPMWVFYVNRGQCIASFGIESKDKALMEFQPANKAYNSTPLNGFRTFIKVTRNKKTSYWEPFQEGLAGTGFKKDVRMSMSAHDLTLVEINKDLGLEVTVNYFTMPDEPYAALIRQVSVKNTQKTAARVEIVDGLPSIVPFGLKDALLKNMSRTAEAWFKVHNVKAKAPYYQLNVEISDVPEVTHIKEGHFYFAFDPDKKSDKLLNPVVEASRVFGSRCDFISPECFLNHGVKTNGAQQTNSRTPSALSVASATLAFGSVQNIVSLFGYAPSINALTKIVRQSTKDGFIQSKAALNREVIDRIKNFAFTHSQFPQFDHYAGATFLDNILRGGLPVSLKTKEGQVAFNVYSRKHGDLERDYNYFVVAPTFYSQGNGNYRDVNQNRRNDAWFNADVRESHLVGFLNLSQADGYNPLVVKGTAFRVKDAKALDKTLKNCVSSGTSKLKEFLSKSFLPGHLLLFVHNESIKLKINIREFLGRVLESCAKEELADHGEGFWTDHWTYNLDLIESFLALYPEDLQKLLLKDKQFSFYLNDHYVLTREQRYTLTDRGVRQYESVVDGSAIVKAAEKGYVLRTKNGEGSAYQTHMACKLLCLIANKAATLDPSGIGVDMEADKPNWYDSLNGLPGLLGSSISETFELKRYSVFLLEALKKLSLSDTSTISVFEELATFITGLTPVLSLEKDAYAYWSKSNDIKERYRQQVLKGISGVEKALSVAEIKLFLERVIKKCNRAAELGKNKKGQLSTYFFHEVTDYQLLDQQKKLVRPKKFKCHHLPLFLEGYVHALRAEEDPKKVNQLYEQVQKSDLYDKKLKMYKVCADLSGESEEIGRTRVFPPGWLENQSIWLHMEYKFFLELIRRELYPQYYQTFKEALVPFLSPQKYGRSVLENSSFIVSSAHEDKELHGRGFVARLSGSTAEFVHMWLLMNAGKDPFSLNVKGELVLEFKPALAGWLFTTKKRTSPFYSPLIDQTEKVEFAANTYAFNFLGTTLVVYHNPKRKDTFGKSKVSIRRIELTYPNRKKTVVIDGSAIGAPYAEDVRSRRVARIDVELS